MRNKPVRGLLKVIFIFLFVLQGCKKEEVIPVVKADFESNISEILVDGEVQFHDLSEGNPNKWEWDFEGANPSVSEKKIHLLVILRLESSL